MKKFSAIFVLISLVFVFVGCNQSELSKALTKIALPNEVTARLNLPTFDETFEIIYEWESNRPDIIASDGTVYATPVDIPVTLTLKATKDEEQKEKAFNVVVKGTDLTPFTRAWDFYRPQITSTAYRDVNFYTGSYGGVEVRYQSNNPNVITNDGIIERGNVDQIATINVILNYQGLEKIFTKDITIAKLSDQTIISMVDEWLPTIINAFQNGEITELPLTHPEFGTRIRYSSTSPEVLIINGKVKEVTTPTTFGLHVEIILGNSTKEQYFTINNFTGGVSEEELLDEWLPTLLPNQILGSKNYVGSNDLLDHQDRINYGGVLNYVNGQMPDIIQDFVGTTDESYLGHVSSGTRPSVPSSTLSELIFDGYEMPNNLGILWIVVHETGMPKIGQDAALLSTHMHYKMIENTMNSSWHYTVDEKSIYHHIPNHLSAWHASDGSTIGGGNRNGIGIELCINEDGNYEGALHNDAKLIAYLMHEYGLTLANVRRHYDFAPDKKVCPNYLIQTNRWNEFLDLVYQEYIAFELLQNANVTWSNNATELFIPGINHMYYNKALVIPTDVEITLTVTKGEYHFNETKILQIGAANE